MPLLYKWGNTSILYRELWYWKKDYIYTYTVNSASDYNSRLSADEKKKVMYAVIHIIAKARNIKNVKNWTNMSLKISKNIGKYKN